ncbi:MULTISPECIES: sigma-54 dependent transcriptional regulator [Thalassospira]|uniref:Sigma-54-dependent Fis family transcriptional regulator n=1 Tax=Thalassospira povalilytica TaxID=732237 RepID=A0A8I1M8J2_9PROT|nr:MULTISPECIES: sigma-54 dependent transcriptional regulator [Thalassospira]MEE3044564.1 sigma-54 dependent transcriptional regulator [Pseudomonadota bacterium]RCK24910.1 ATPase AAA [Thalassospira profundimaris]KZB60785.1 AAA family ATPase [Thalassospira sp. MCCC 1A02491]MAL41892.1 sigma-54-dependent Fis family transcriptional regulator [Thalassospira sp.]MBN8197353.1 sigma-54-dependent Fis family transcriptional regulator [Thalassospira povalilytica]|tara:strand:+ start:64 stop:1437 length:1374 start_codon:yes stop_codon:yes gene_type:complete|eukprot:TRINITY_DN655_c0_g5_i1.p1 TRINITY_DN655_c0_g5~~TRINITY_DN655_c0_g5_i1.p1  ORF type:complete len:458 (+),score=90.32 TRINITY_DN655_c0_g5_i1:1096-2469(+)
MAHDILIVDDEQDIRALISGILEDEGYTTRQAGSSQEALAEVSARRPSLVVLDIWMDESDHDGIETLKLIKREHSEVPVVMISGHGNIETALEASRIGAYDFIEKPFNTDRLLMVVERAIDDARLRRENRELTLRAGGDTELLGKSSVINNLRQSVDRVARTGSRILIHGPAGSGKEVVARLIHQKSARAEAPFVVLNCANISPETMEESLFGAVATADREARTGVLELAHGGTLLLDEVADMPLETQGKIVRVLQDQTFERVGGSVPVSVDVRVIATTARDLEQRIAEQTFRQDLYYRLNVVPLEVPSLQQRRDDIPELAERFLERYADATGLPKRKLSPEAMATLHAYDWPGNVRQLRNVIERLMIMAPDDDKTDLISGKMLPSELFSDVPTSLSFDKTSEIMALPLREAREMFEKEYLQTQIDRFGGNISKTASFVGMERSALHRKLKSLGVNS